MSEKLTVKKVAAAVEELANMIGELTVRVENLEKVLKDHCLEADAHHPGFLSKQENA
jgi:hypothetical protein